MLSPVLGRGQVLLACFSLYSLLPGLPPNAPTLELEALSSPF